MADIPAISALVGVIQNDQAFLGKAALQAAFQNICASFFHLEYLPKLPESLLYMKSKMRLLAYPAAYEIQPYSNHKSNTPHPPNKAPKSNPVFLNLPN